MATTTPNYGWTVPTSTDLVKDGATAIETLGDAIDASMNTALGTKKAGMVLLNTTSFSGVSSQSVNNVFSATYDDYRILIDFTASASFESTILRYRLSGTDANAADTYKSQEIEASSTTVEATRRSGTSALLGAGSNTANSVSTSIIDLFNVSLASPTGIQTHNFSSANNGFLRSCHGFHTVSTAYDGFTFSIASGTVTGTIRVYGYNK
jgi:hypothetical protein